MRASSFVVGVLAIMGAAGCGGSEDDSRAGGAAGSGAGAGGTGGGSAGSGGGSGSAGGPSGGAAGSSAGTGGAAGGANGCDGSANCLHVEGTHDGNPFDLTCTGGETAFAPTSANPPPSAPDAFTYTGVCAIGNYTVQVAMNGLSVEQLAVGTYDYAPGIKAANGVDLNLQVNENPAKQIFVGGPNCETASLTITAHEPRTALAGTFSAQWSEDLTIDIHTVEWKHLCLDWQGTGCDTGLGMAVPTACTCLDPGPLFAGEATGSFHYEFQ